MVLKTASALITPLEDSTPGLTKIAAEFNIDTSRYLPVVVSGIEGDVFNSNLDMYPWVELLPQTREGKVAAAREDAYYGWPTWIDKPVCKQHQPQLGKYGYIVDAYPRPEATDIPMLLAIDRFKDPVLVDKVASGEQRDVSMGCLVQYVRCSFCGKKSASGPKDFCEHLLRSRGAWLPRKEGMKHCAAAMNGDHVRVGEVCYGLRGQEMSIVYKGAFASSKVLELPKVASDQSSSLPPAVALALQTLQDYLIKSSN